MYNIDGMSFKTPTEMADYIIDNSEDGLLYDYSQWCNESEITLDNYREIIHDGIRLDIENMKVGECLRFYNTDVWVTED